MSPRTFSFRRAGRLSAVLASLAIGLAACGDDDSDEGTSATSEGSAASAEEVTLTAVEYEFDLSATPTADTKTVTFQNDGKEPHVLIFARINEGFTLDEAFKLEGKKGSAEEIGEADAGPGQTATVDIKEPLEPGQYAMLCPLPGKGGEPHYKLGQLAEFEIK